MPWFYHGCPRSRLCRVNPDSEHLGILVVDEESQSCGGSVISTFKLQGVADGQYDGRNIRKIGFLDDFLVVVVQGGQIVMVGCTNRHGRE